MYIKKTILTLILLLNQAYASQSTNELNVYSARKEALIKPLLDSFSKKYNIKVNLITAKASSLLAKIKLEGKRSPADIFITTDAGRLHQAKKKGLLQKLDISNLNLNQKFIDSDLKWVALSIRARVIFYNKNKINKSKLSTYQALASNKFNKKICIRSSSNIYNQSLIASMIYNIGPQRTNKFLKSFVNNFARKPKGGDRDQIKAVASGICDIAVANTYYYKQMLNNNKNKELLKNIGVFWPNQDSSGTHINVSGIAIVKNAPNKKNAQKLIEFLLNDQSQNFYAKVNHEFPIKNTKKWLKLNNENQPKMDDMKLSILGDLNKQAVILMDKAGWQ